ncbi:dynamin GTPase [Xylogone sp. PMI_703]|nr:dynamin GTPase [Xylogone sp. PMI_703]
MGIPGPGQSLEAEKSTFSEDLLSIEICGPEQQNLSIIDIPGIFRTPTEGVTTKEDIDLVRKIMLKYIKDERTIILAVIPSNVDIATQEILTIAKELDPEGVRTLGVLTKPDLIDKGGEENILELVEGKRNALRLGYCIVRNRGQSELSTDYEARHKKEKAFFSTEPWSRLDIDRVGIPALQKRLQSLLVSTTRREFPKVQAEIAKKLSDREGRLMNLGADRESAAQQRQFLLEMAQKFQDLTTNALDSYYSRHPAFARVPELRLATLVVARNERYSNDMEALGHTYQFISDGVRHELKFKTTPGSYSESTKETRSLDLEYPELSDLVADYDAISTPIGHGIMAWLEEEYQKARGFGLVSIGPSVVPTIWQEQSKNWKGLTLDYIKDIILLVHDFVYKVLSEVCPDEGVHSNLWSIIEEQLRDSYLTAIRHVLFIIDVERFGTPMTMNPSFKDNLEESKASQGNGPFSEPEEARVMVKAEHTIQQLHDILKSYYEVARKRFVDTICMQGSDAYLLTGPTSPLRIFGTSFVSRLSDTQLDLIAGEDVATKQLRKSLKSEIDALKKGKKLLRA